MIEIAVKKMKDAEIKLVDKTEPGCWINIVSPTKAEIEKISSEFEISADILYDMLDINEMPLVDKEDDFTYIIIRVPYKSAEKIITIPLGIIIKENVFITICPYDNEVIEHFKKGMARNFYTTKRTRFLLQIFSRANYYYMKYLNEIYKHIEKSEATHKKLRNEDIMYLVELEESLLYFSSSVTSNANALERILTGKIMKLYKDDEDILEDIIIDNKQTMEMSKIYSKIIVNVREAYSSVITNNLNKILKFLAAVTVILTIPMIITGLYGMNIDLPIQQSPLAFYAVMLIILVFSLMLFAVFYRKDWI